jgi:hypothetical protein
MRIRMNLIHLIGIAYILFMTIMALTSVGKPSGCDGVFPWHLPIQVFLVVTVPFIAGIIAEQVEND